jgi:hypothetical protein
MFRELTAKPPRVKFYVKTLMHANAPRRERIFAHGCYQAQFAIMLILGFNWCLAKS